MSDGQIIVTGASRGIGEAIPVELDRRGFRVAGLSRSGTCPVGSGVVCDMTDETSIACGIAKVAADGAIIGLVNNAGAREASPSAELSLAEFEKHEAQRVSGFRGLPRSITSEAVQMHGGYGYCSDYRVERLMRDAKITQIWEGTNQVHRQLIGRSFVTR